MNPESDAASSDSSTEVAVGLAQALEHIGSMLRGLSYGELRVVVQDGVVVQIDCTEKRRLRKPCRVSD